MEGCYKGHVKIVKIFIAAKAEINTQTKVNLMLSPTTTLILSSCILLLHKYIRSCTYFVALPCDRPTMYVCFTGCLDCSSPSSSRRQS